MSAKTAIALAGFLLCPACAYDVLGQADFDQQGSGGGDAGPKAFSGEAGAMFFAPRSGPLRHLALASSSSRLFAASDEQVWWIPTDGSQDKLTDMRSVSLTPALPGGKVAALAAGTRAAYVFWRAGDKSQLLRVDFAGSVSEERQFDSAEAPDPVLGNAASGCPVFATPSGLLVRKGDCASDSAGKDWMAIAAPQEWATPQLVARDRGFTVIFASAPDGALLGFAGDPAGSWPLQATRIQGADGMVAQCSTPTARADFWALLADSPAAAPTKRCVISENGGSTTQPLNEAFPGRCLGSLGSPTRYVFASGRVRLDLYNGNETHLFSDFTATVSVGDWLGGLRSDGAVGVTMMQ